jgi:hypothetical protein
VEDMRPEAEQISAQKVTLAPKEVHYLIWLHCLIWCKSIVSDLIWVVAMIYKIIRDEGGLKLHLHTPKPRALLGSTIRTGKEIAEGPKSTSIIFTSLTCIKC